MPKTTIKIGNAGMSRTHMEDFITFHTVNIGSSIEFSDQITLLGRNYEIQGFDYSDPEHTIIYANPAFSTKELFSIKKRGN